MKTVHSNFELIWGNNYWGEAESGEVAIELESVCDPNITGYKRKRGTIRIYRNGKLETETSRHWAGLRMALAYYGIKHINWSLVGASDIRPEFKLTKREREQLMDDTVKPIWVYFVQCKVTGLIKIGCTDNWSRRWAGMQGASPTELEPLAFITDASVETEAQLHILFHASNAHHEWFRPTQDLLDFIKSSELTSACVYKFVARIHKR